MSKGVEVIGSFNSSTKVEVDLIKEKAIELVDLIEKHGVDGHRKDNSIDYIEVGVMLAIKSLFH